MLLLELLLHLLLLLLLLLLPWFLSLLLRNSKLKSPNRPRYSNSTKKFKRPKNREDSSDLDKKKHGCHRSDEIYLWKKFLSPPGLKKHGFRKFVSRKTV